MITFTLCLLALMVGYFTYGRLMERVFGPDDRKTSHLIFPSRFINFTGFLSAFSAKQFSKQTFRLFSGRLYIRIRDTFNVAGQINLSLFQIHPVYMQIRALYHEHSLLRLQQYLIQIKRQDIQHSGHQSGFPVI